MPKIKKQKVNHPYLLEEALLKTGETIFNINGTLEKVVTKFYQREQIPVGVKFQGPCIVLQKDTTTVIPPNCTAFIEEFGNMIIKVGV
ncbi:N-methylhydantoinase A [Niallia nealsonii AAU1]|nr:N-methylhydantoinase A [Niallia nealsonii AAU1]